MTDTNRSLLESAQALVERLEPGDLDATLAAITSAAVDLLPDVTSASISVRHGDGRIETVHATDDGLLALDQAQYRLQEGPCFEAASDTPYLVAHDLRTDPRFPQYGPTAADAGITAQAAFRLFDRGGAKGALNLYSTKADAFVDLDDLAALFRSHAAVAIAYAHEITGLTEALHTRTTIGKAMGVVMERYQLTDERAFAFLTRLSQYRNVKLRLVAEELVAEAAQSAETASAVKSADGQESNGQSASGHSRS